MLAGGVALNCVANGRLLREGPFDDIWIQPAAGDAGGALGAALFVWHQLLDKPRTPTAATARRAASSGRAFDDGRDLRVSRRRRRALPARVERSASCSTQVADLLVDEKIVGWFQGRMEFGPRALGARSILGDPRSPKMQATMNLKIKFRESFRPFAPCVLQERGARVVRARAGAGEPVHAARRAGARASTACRSTDEQRATMASDPDLRNRVNIPRSTIPAVTHVDYSARLQTVDDERNPRLHGAADGRSIERTGCPVLVNTSFNVRGEPIVCTPAGRVPLLSRRPRWMRSCSRTSIVLKRTSPDSSIDAARAKYLAQFQLD